MADCERSIHQISQRGRASDLQRGYTGNLHYTSSNIQRADQKTSRTRAILRSLDPPTMAIQDYGSAMDTFANISPAQVARIWGSIRVVLVIANSHGKFYDRMIETFARIGDILPRLRKYDCSLCNYVSLLTESR